MTPLTLEELSLIVGGLEVSGTGLIKGFATDNRQVKPGDLFLAIKGANVDGHDFVADAVRRGAVGALVERPVDGPFVRVENLVEALAKFGANFRNRFDGPVIGITGSAGKTTTKEFLASALSPLGTILKTVGNRNTEYTAPLLWADLTSDTSAVVVEMAMRGFGQIAHLASFSKPTMGVITNIGYSHLEQMKSREGIAKAKGELIEALPADGVAILPEDDDFIGMLRDLAGQRPVLTFGFGKGADCRLIEVSSDGLGGSVVKGFFADIPWQTSIPVIGKHLAANAAAAIAAAVTLGLSPQEAADALCEADLPPMRMQLIDRNGVQILLDAYNAAPPSMIAAIEALAEMEVDGRRLAVIGEMRELGDQTEAAHRSIGAALVRTGIDEVLFVGEPMKFAKEETDRAGLRTTLTTVPEEASAFVARAGRGDAILIKGSRALALENALGGNS